MERVWHIAISSHFLLLWALALYLENVRNRRFAPLKRRVLYVLNKTDIPRTPALVAVASARGGGSRRASCESIG